MDICLIYRGNVASRNRAVAKDKHAIRCQLHPQIKRFWDLTIASQNENRTQHENYWTPFKLKKGDGDVSLLETRGNSTFATTVSDAAGWCALCRLSFTFFEHDIRSGIGDIDNKVKTLMDALSLPPKADAAELEITSTPFHCLLANDRLVTSYSVDRRTIFTGKQSQTPDDDFVVIDARVYAARHTLFNSAIW